ncbi:biotin transporter BioY [Nitratireductor basaltis]|uniref:Biotin transporter n=1 Tax=Nitratireductor basaltis TaxID=472175 RepID=A0A084UCN7_9HYPH|nr:biotin transporter BioY [Nitratireductor basaltis]KFB10723.1 BioY protein [Nitratireductor basaltis]
MSEAIASRPLVSLALPESGAARLAAQAGLALTGSLLLALSAKTKVVLGPVDMSMQSLVIMLIAAGFGFRLGVATLLLYIAEGAMGLPVFQGTPEKGIGLAYMVGPTGGYLLGFVAMAAIVGAAADRGFDRNPLKMGAATVAASAVVLALGFAWLAVLIGADKAWQFGVAPFILPDLVKAALAACVTSAGWAALRGFGLGGR